MQRDKRSYSIRQAAERTGLSKQVIRKWEERYQIVRPLRLDNGYRMYSESDLRMLLAVKALVNEGHSIKESASLAEKRAQSEDIAIQPEIRQPDESAGLNNYVLGLLQEGEQCNDTEVSRILQQAYHSHGLVFFIESIVIPFLKEVGSRWERGAWGEYQEALASHAVRDFLVQLRRNFKCRDDAPVMLGAVLPYEQHDVPVLFILLQAMLKGWNTVFLGASPAPGAIESAVRRLSPDKVVLSAMTGIPFERDPGMVGRLDRFASQMDTIRFYMGGPGSVHISSSQELRSIRVTGSLEEVLSCSGNMDRKKQ